jgi:hypothetical protein
MATPRGTRVAAPTSIQTIDGPEPARRGQVPVLADAHQVVGGQAQSLPGCPAGHEHRDDDGEQTELDCFDELEPAGVGRQGRNEAEDEEDHCQDRQGQT